MLATLLFLMACGVDPTVSAVTPNQVRGGTTVQVLGDGFSEDATLSVKGEGEEILLSVVNATTVAISGELPRTIEVGTYDVIVKVGSSVVVAPDAITVTRPDDERPCDRTYQSNARVSMETKSFKIERIFEQGTMKGKSEVVSIPVSEVKSVEYQRLVPESSRPCSAIFVRKKNGERYIFGDDDKVDLQKRAYQISKLIKKPVIEVQPQNAPEVTAPVD